MQRVPNAARTQSEANSCERASCNHLRTRCEKVEDEMYTCACFECECLLMTTDRVLPNIYIYIYRFMPCVGDEYMVNGGNKRTSYFVIAQYLKALDT